LMNSKDIVTIRFVETRRKTALSKKLLNRLPTQARL
jgi:hypothetical protein